MDKIELELQKRICQANIVGTVLLIAAFVIPIFAVGSVNWIVEGAFKLPGQSDFVFCFVGTFIISVFASVFFILGGITKKILKEYEAEEIIIYNEKQKIERNVDKNLWER